MTERITSKNLEAVCRRINRGAGFADDTPLWTRVPLVPELPDRYRHVATVGMYSVSGAYGGYALHRMVDDGGGVTDVFRSGHVPARDLYNRMQAYLDGLDGGAERRVAR